MHGGFTEVSDLDALGHLAAPLDELGAAMHEAPLVDTTALAFAIGEDVGVLLDHLVEQVGAPAFFASAQSTVTSD